MTSAYLSLMVLCILCVLPMGHSRSMRLVKYSEQEPCDLRQPCGWAVCPWKPDLIISRTNCDFVNMPCRCPGETVCRLTEVINPDTRHITVPKKCQPKLSSD